MNWRVSKIVYKKGLCLQMLVRLAGSLKSILAKNLCWATCCIALKQKHHNNANHFSIKSRPNLNRNSQTGNQLRLVTNAVLSFPWTSTSCNITDTSMKQRQGQWQINSIQWKQVQWLLYRVSRTFIYNTSQWLLDTVMWNQSELRFDDDSQNK